MSEAAATPTPSTAPSEGTSEPNPWAWAEDAAAEEPGEDQPVEEGDDQAEEEHPAAAQGEEEEPSKSQPSGKGTKDSPFSLDDIATQYVRVKVDGEEALLSLKEAAEGGIRTATLQKRMAQLAEATKDVEATETAMRGFITRLQSDDQFQRSWLKQYAPQAFQRAVEAEIRDLVALEQMKPEERVAKELAAEKAQLEAAKAKWEAEQAEARQQQAVRQAHAHLQPLLEGAAKAHGLPFSREYVSLMRTALEPVFAAGRVPSKEEITKAASDIAKWRGISPKPATPPPQQQTTTRRAPRTSAPKGKPRAGPVDTSDFFNELRRAHRR